jgi:hypothetical protein
MAKQGTHYGFPNYVLKRPRAKQPDYAKWLAVKVGMTRAEVVELLGKPIRGPYLVAGDSYWNYGYLELPMMPHVRTYQFLIGFDDDSKVWMKEDPFGGVLSIDGKPSKPMIFTPTERTRFKHFPRLVDMRWQPVSGVYPMRYELQISSAGYHEKRRRFLYEEDNFRLEVVPFPYFIHQFVGDNPGRFRVRGVNRLGKGEWSDYRRFKFDTSDKWEP